MVIFINCTETFKTGLQTGIQRVVRQISFHKPTNPEISLIPVVFDGIGFYSVTPDSLIVTKPSNLSKLRDHFINSPLFPILRVGFRALHKILPYVRLTTIKPDYLSISSPNVILNPDIINDLKLAHNLAKLKSEGVKVFHVAHDLLPITSPALFFKSSVAEFKKTSAEWSKFSTKIFAVSQKVASEVRDILGAKDVDYFHLGCDFKASASQELTPKTGNYFLTVGTVEPRKNHLHILRTFEKLWKNGSAERLIIIGRIGWNCSKIQSEIERLKTQFPGQLEWLNNASDQSLEKHYLGAQAVICASFDEGFGLPVVESLARRKNVLCSDIPVFHEVGLDHCTYFDFSLEGEKSLFEIIKKNKFHKDLSNYKPLTWHDAVEILIEKIVKDCQ